MLEMVRRHVMTLDLKDDPELIEQYRAWHRPGGPPPAIIESLRATGIAEMEIFLSGNRLVMILACNELSFDTLVKLNVSNADIQAWETLMWKFQKALPWAKPGEKWLTMERIFALSEQ
jgi:L-rhamnose mutarotase